MKTITSRESDETIEIGRKLAPKLIPNSILCLYGELGAGKTTFIKGLARGLGIEEAVTSPSYVLLREYGDGTTLYHLDLFRLERVEEFGEAGLEEYLVDPEGVVAIEWADRIEELLPPIRIDVQLGILDQTSREIQIIQKS
ncbi:MAG: tRNA (adenosine(37)-N6)-threonylcarbamoyltransferase complex ATPase subunit type 1 TsaE [Candidatus Acetothermia bacterium]